jgi:outer membrane protein assembly factor BamA
MRYSKYSHLVLVLLFLLFPGNICLFAQDSLKINNLHSDTSDIQYLINSIQITGNQKTHENIILRELTFKEGDRLTESSLKLAIEQSRTNLLKQPLFNYVTIEILPLSSNLCNIDIIVEERWFLWPQLAIINNDRNFNTWMENHDFSRLDYRLSVKKYNVLGLNHILQAGISYGYTREVSLGYKNVAIDKKQKHLLGIYARYSQYKSYNYQNFNNKQENFTSYDKDALDHKYIRFEYLFRPNINIWHRLYLSFQQVNASDSLISANPGFLAGSKNNNTFLEAWYLLTLDKRDSRSYPLSGFWMDLSIIKTGFNFKRETEVNLLNISTTIKDFYHIGGKFYAAHSLTLKKSLSGFQPYFYKENLGYIDFLRGFEYYVIEGDDYYLSKNGIKFELLPQTIKYLNFIPIRKFKKIHYAMYLNAYFDMGYAHEKNAEENLYNNLSDQFLYSGGVGFDLVTYYDKVLRIEYSINNLNQSGFYFHFIAPI